MRVIVLDPARRSEDSNSIRRTHALINALRQRGALVDWYVDCDDVLEPAEGIDVHRLLPRGLGIVADLSWSDVGRIDNQCRHEPSPDRTSNASSQVFEIESKEAGFDAPSLSGHGVGFHAAAVARRDTWARATWHDPHSSKANRVAALLLWVSIRLLHASRWYLDTGTYHVRAAILRMYRIVRWRIIHPTIERCVWLAKASYWRAIYPVLVEPAGNFAKRVRWQVVHPTAQFLRPLRARFASILHRFGLMSRVRGSADLARTVLGRIGVTPNAQPSFGEENVDPWSKMFVLAAKNWLSGNPPSIILLPNAEPLHLEAMFALVAEFDLSGPQTIPVVGILSTDTRFPKVVPADTASVAVRWRTGSPFSWFYPFAIGDWPDAGFSDCGNRWADIELSPAVVSKPEEMADEILEIAAQPGKDSRGRMSCDQFGPLAIVLSALWGRVGSTEIFETQIRFLLRSGYRVARVYVDHWPQTGKAGVERTRSLLYADQSLQRSHMTLIMERDYRASVLRRIVSTPKFEAASSVGRLTQLLGACVGTDSAVAEYLKRYTKVTIVNHAQHVLTARILTDAPIVLETHDILSDLLRLHSVPAFVPPTIDSREQRIKDEQNLWSDVDYCVNLSSSDHEVVAPYARRSALIRPYRLPARRTGRSWPEIVDAHSDDHWSRNAISVGRFDLMLWGTWHNNNIRSIRWFLDDVLPKITAFEHLRVVVAGAVLRGIGDLSDVKCDLVTCPRVDFLEDLADRATVAVIPDLDGTGISIKMMDALAWGACFAATASALRDLDISETELPSAETAEIFAADIDNLLANRSARASRRRIATQLFSRNYSPAAYTFGWGRVFDDLDLPRTGFQISSPDRSSALSSANGGVASRRGTPRVSVVVVCLNNHALLPDTLRSIESQTAANFVETVVVDISADIAAATGIAARYAEVPGLKYLVERAPSIREARNLGIRAATGELVAFVGSDAIINPNWARAMINCFDSLAQSTVAVVGRTIPRWVKARPSWLSDSLLRHLSLADWPGPSGMLSKCDWIPDCNVVIRKSVLLPTTGLHPLERDAAIAESPPTNEQADLDDRLSMTEGAIFYEPSAIVERVIDPDSLTKGWFRRRAAWQAVSDFNKAGKNVAEYALRSDQRLRGKIADNHGSLVAVGGANDDEVGLVYDVMMSLLSGGVELSDESAEKSFDSEGRQSVFPLQTPLIPASSVGGYVKVPRISVVIATYNRYDTLPLAINSLLSQKVPSGFLEIIVVDNSPDRARAEEFATLYAEAKYVSFHYEPKPGLSNARNVGLGKARGVIVAYIDDDAVAAPDWALRLEEAFRRVGDRVGVIGGRVLPRFVSQRPAWLSDDLMMYLSVVDWGGELRELKATSWVVGCNMAFFRERLVDVGGFPCELGRSGSGHSLLSNDESAVIDRMRDLGYAKVYAPKVLVEHIIDPARLKRSWFRRRVAWQAVSDYILKPGRSIESAPSSAKHLELVSAGRLSRAPLGAFTATEDADVFRQDVAIAYDLALVMLAGGMDEIRTSGGLQRDIATVVRDSVRARVRANPVLLRLSRRSLSLLA